MATGRINQVSFAAAPPARRPAGRLPSWTRRAGARVVALSLPVGVQRQQHLCCDGGAGAGVEATSERARAPRGGGIGGSSLGASAVDWSAIAPRPRMPRRLTAFNGSDAPTLVLTRRRRCRPVGVCVCAFE